MGIAQHLDAVRFRHLDICNDDIENGALKLFLGGVTTVNDLNLIPLTPKSDFQHFADGAFVVANEDVTHAPLLPPLLRSLTFSEPLLLALLPQPDDEGVE